MANQEHLDIFGQGLAAWNSWRQHNPDARPDLDDADLRDANLGDVDLASRQRRLYRADFSHTSLKRANLRGVYVIGADFSQADLAGANLSGTFLVTANLTEADLHRTDLRGAILNGARLILADLTEARLEEADLQGADLKGARLAGADFRNCTIGWTTFGDTDVSVVRCLDTVEHRGPSVIGIDTIYRSNGRIPDVFLRGAGIPESFITYMHSLVGRPFDFYSCFICHSTRDKRFCDRLYADLKARGVRTWYFPEDARWGESLWGEIDRSIKVYDKLVVVCSENALQSGPVLREIERALNREDREDKNILFPIRIDNYVFERWEHERKADVLSKVIGDFRGWSRSPAKYERSLKRLVEALQAEEARPIAQASPGS